MQLRDHRRGALLERGPPADEGGYQSGLEREQDAGYRDFRLYGVNQGVQRGAPFRLLPFDESGGGRLYISERRTYYTSISDSLASDAAGRATGQNAQYSGIFPRSRRVRDAANRPHDNRRQRGAIQHLVGGRTA